MSISVDDFLKDYAHILTNDALRALAVMNALSHEVRPDGKHFVDHKSDPGGATNWGISLRFLKSLGTLKGDIDGDGDVDADDIRALTLEQVSQIYVDNFWTPYGIYQLPPRMAVKVFDMAVNMGPVQAIKILQRALKMTGHNIKLDGKLGPRTIKAATDGFDARSATRAGRALLQDGLIDDIRLSAGAFYERLVTNNPAFKVFSKGWQRRAET